MTLQLNKNQIEVLGTLLDKYENSKTYRGENVRNQSFSITPEKVFPEYDGDYTDQEEVNQFNRDMQSLAELNLVVLQIRKGTPVILGITVNTEQLTNIYELLGRKDITEIRNVQIEMYKQYKGIHQVIDEFCDVQVERLSNFKDAEYDIEEAINILKLLECILTNKQEIMERELSVAVLGDTKLFKNSYMTRICKIIEKYGSLAVDISGLEKNEKEKVILEEFHILSNPSYVFFKGNVTIRYSDGSEVIAKPYNPIAISSEVISRIEEVTVFSINIITVENLTSYNRVNDPQSVFIYLSGYHNTVKQKFLMKVAENNKNVKWYHFGDIDPDGYYILKNLIDKTKISFEPMNMGIEQLKKYKQYCKKLEKNDMNKATSLKACEFYGEVMQYMLENNCKLEQEIISWLENKDIKQ